MRRSKYGNIKTVVDGRIFASKREAARYQELRLLLRAGKIHDLQCHPAFACVVNERRVCTYIADFQYYDVEKGETVTEDVKSGPTKTAVYRLKKKLVAAILGVGIVEVS